MAKGQKTANIMDVPLSVSSVVTGVIGDNGYKFDGADTVRVLSVANGSLANYDETNATTPFGAATLVVPDEQVLTLAYNKSMLLRIQRSQIQDIPVSQFAKTTALQQVNEVFVPAHDAYSLAKIFAARPTGNITEKDATRKDRGIKTMVDKARTGGASINSLVTWITYSLAAEVADAISYTGSDAGFTVGKQGYLGKIAGVNTIETPDAYFFAGVHAITADKRAIVNVPPKMDPNGDGMVVIDPVPGFSGIEIQLRDRADTFVLNKKKRTVATLETAASTTTTV